MFDIGFSEIMVIAVVALIVIGPERLPKVARTLGHLFGRMQRYVNDVKSDISREMELEELRALQTEMKDAAKSFETTVHKELSETEKALNQTIAPLTEGIGTATGATTPAVETAAAPAAPDSAPAAEASVPPPSPESAEPLPPPYGIGHVAGTEPHVPSKS
jgi:sec-independent protein translocase protein TatB